MTVVLNGLEPRDPSRGVGSGEIPPNNNLLGSSSRASYTERHAWVFVAALGFACAELVMSPVILVATAVLLGGRLVAWQWRRQMVFPPALVGRELALVMSAWFAFAGLVYLTDLALQFTSFALATLPRVVPWVGPDLSDAEGAVEVIVLHGTLSSVAMVTLLRWYAHVARSRDAARFGHPIAPA